MTATAISISIAIVFPAAAAAFEMPSSWQSAYFRDNPLVGTIHADDGTLVDPAAFARAVAEADYLLAGETHDNADHHLLQATMIEAMVAAGGRPAVVFEMVATDLQPAIDAFLASPAPDADTFGAAVTWSERGWPDYAIYRPIVEAALAAKLPIRAGDLPRETIRGIGRDGIGSLAALEIERLSLVGEMPAAEVAELSLTLKESHCGMLPDRAVAPMLAVQRARDGALAAATRAAANEAGGGKAVLVAGSGHVRKDWAVSALVAAKEPGARIVSIAMIEVSSEETTPAAYGLTPEDPAPYDYVLFTPRGDISDPCEGMAEAMGKAKPTPN